MCNCTYQFESESTLSEQETVMGRLACLRAETNCPIPGPDSDGSVSSKKRACRSGSTSTTLSPTSSRRAGAMRGIKPWELLQDTCYGKLNGIGIYRI